MAKLVVDDERTFAGDGFIYFRTSESAMANLAGLWTHQQLWDYEANIEELWLDHDLGLNENDVACSVIPLLHFLKALAMNKCPLNVGVIYAHTMNGVGGDYIVDSLKLFYNVKRVSLPELVHG